ncbi:MAG: DUF58 domain-containing protein [Oscillospiraceae bacterium]|nr:DUF58 domain-containing protein [Oscillospiraceae bacterium]
MRIVYFFLLAFSVAFHILYKGDLSFVLLMFMIILPLITLAVLIYSVVMTDVSAGFEQLSAQRGKSAILKVTVRNKSVFPVICCVVEVVYKSLIPFDANGKNKYRLDASIGARASETFVFNISAAHCGTAEIYIKRVLLRDYLRIFAIPVKVSAKGKCISLPVIYPVQASVESSPVSADDGTAFSPYKPGDDPSEIFALREYREGDSNNRIHWKLSSRTDDFIVKELSLPIGCNILIAVDFFGCRKASAADKVLDAAFSISYFLAEYGLAHSLAYALSGYGIKKLEIDSADKHLNAVTEICSEISTVNVFCSFTQMASSDEFFASRKHFSRVIVVSDSTDYARIDELETLFGEAYLTIICTGTPDTSDNDNTECRAEIIYADAEKLSEHELLII